MICSHFIHAEWMGVFHLGFIRPSVAGVEYNWQTVSFGEAIVRFVTRVGRCGWHVAEVNLEGDNPRSFPVELALDFEEMLSACAVWLGDSDDVHAWNQIRNSQ
jgi:hypothetical protein